VGVGSRRVALLYIVTAPRIAKDFFGHTIRSPVQEDVEFARRKTDNFRLEWYNFKTVSWKNGVFVRMILATSKPKYL
jgi:hypothetical protein